jgi:HEPN domain-containing protein
MQALTPEWIAKAEGDFITAGREIRARKDPNYDACCFHSQQCVEKYLKARLQESKIQFPKTHDLEVLLDLSIPIEPTWAELRPGLQILTVFGVDIRYPGMSVSKEEAKEAFKVCKTVRQLVRSSLGLST